MVRRATWSPTAFQCQHANQLGLLLCGPHSSSVRARGLEKREMWNSNCYSTSLALLLAGSVCRAGAMHCTPMEMVAANGG
jgi:hypothetical protein